MVRFGAESIYSGAAVVIEAKRDASYNVPKALGELETGRSNRIAQGGVFVMAKSHAPQGFPAFARYGNDVLVVWDETDEYTDPYLQAALFLALGLATAHFTPGVGLPASIGGAALGFSLFYGIAWYYQWRTGRAGMGGGDIKFLAMLGAFLGRRCVDPRFPAGVMVAVDTSGEGRDAGLDDLGTRVQVLFYSGEEILAVAGAEPGEASASAS